MHKNKSRKSILSRTNPQKSRKISNPVYKGTKNPKKSFHKSISRHFGANQQRGKKNDRHMPPPSPCQTLSAHSTSPPLFTLFKATSFMDCIRARSWSPGNSKVHVKMTSLGT